VAAPLGAERLIERTYAAFNARDVRDLAGHVLKEEDVRHVYTFEDGLITSMEIQKATVADR
jgi:hypothetical protein